MGVRIVIRKHFKVVKFQDFDSGVFNMNVVGQLTLESGNVHRHTPDHVGVVEQGHRLKL